MDGIAAAPPIPWPGPRGNRKRTFEAAIYAAPPLDAHGAAVGGGAGGGGGAVAGTLRPCNGGGGEEAGSSDPPWLLPAKRHRPDDRGGPGVGASLHPEARALGDDEREALRREAAELGRRLAQLEAQRLSELSAMHAAASAQLATAASELTATRRALDEARAEVARLEEEGRVLKRGVAIAVGRGTALEARAGESAAALERANDEVRRLQACNYELRLHLTRAVDDAGAGGAGGRGRSDGLA